MADYTKFTSTVTARTYDEAVGFADAESARQAIDAFGNSNYQVGGASELKVNFNNNGTYTATSILYASPLPSPAPEISPAEDPELPEPDPQEQAEWDSPPAVTDEREEDPQELAEWDSPPAVTDSEFEPQGEEYAEWDSPPAVTDEREEDPQEQAEWDSPPAVTDPYERDPQEQAEWDLNPEQLAAAQEAGIKQQARDQQTLGARLKTPSNGDWRVRLSLAPNSDYLYNDETNSLLAPLKATNGVIFPYVPSIETNYRANYDVSDLTHSNYRGYFYKNSFVDAVQIRGTFTAQDTKEANYLLAVIHFFRSVTKMFYGQDPAYRGAPPPLTYLNGLGQYQFSNHPCLVSNFTYSLPNDVDYVRVDPNNYGLNMLAQRTPAFTGAGNLLSAIKARLFSAGGIPMGAFAQPQNQGTVVQTVNTNSRASYVPTKMEISITLLPVQSRSQVSQQFSLKKFANGEGLKGGFW